HVTGVQTCALPIGDDEREGLAQVARREVADVAALADLDAGVGAQPLVELPVADVHGDDLRRAPLQQAVGEPAGRGAGVERPPAPGVDAGPVARGVELLAGARGGPAPV